MTWRSTTSPTDRLFACLPYVLPLIEVVSSFGIIVFTQFPVLEFVFLPLQPFILVYALVAGLLPFGGFIIFLALYLLVVRNESIPHFIRFNTMQSILIGFVVSIVGLLWFSVLGRIIRVPLISEVVAYVLFFGTVAAVVYSIVQAARGRYPEIPPLSDAAYMQTR